jgi:DNA-binding GntR family transcriptional regulator
MNSADKLREQLEQDIIAGNLKPGEKLDEVALTERFTVSRTPIREALHRLSSSGLIEIKPRRGAFVRKFSLAEIMEMFEVMSEMEGVCARLAARRINSEQRQQLQAALDACNKAELEGDSDNFYHANVEFHHVIYEACHNVFLCDKAKDLHLRLAPYRRLQLQVRHRMHESQKEHIEVAKSILDGNIDASELLMKSHVAVQGEKFSDIVSKLNVLQ